MNSLVAEPRSSIDGFISAYEISETA
jgi:hypothetical protein